MAKHKHCEYFGSLEKIEEFSTLSQNIVPGSLVFESLSPFMGYYNDLVKDNNPLYVYIIINRTYAVFDVVRALQKVNAELDYKIDAAKAFVKFNDRSYNAIRVRHLQSYENVREIQEAFIRNGISLLLTNDHQKKVSVHVSLKKVFCLSNISGNLYLDACEENHAYLEIPKTLSFDEFVTVTQKVKNNWLESKFDAALGYFMRKEEVVEFVRIYSDKLDEDSLLKIQELYLKKIKYI